jgi:hypothetical protein
MSVGVDGESSSSKLFKVTIKGPLARFQGSTDHHDTQALGMRGQEPEKFPLADELSSAHGSLPDFLVEFPHIIVAIPASTSH